MLDPKMLRTQTEIVAENLKQRGFALDIPMFSALEEKRRVIQEQTQALQNQRNQISKSIGIAKGKGEPTESLMASVATLGSELTQLEKELESIQKALHDFQANIPNLLDASVPAGQSEADNVEVSRFGIVPAFSFTPRDHIALGEMQHGLDFEAAAKLSGARFTVMSGFIAKLHRALSQFMLDLHTKEHGYTELNVPVLVKPECLFGTAQLPKFEEDLFHVAGETELYLISTSEISLTNLAREMIFSEEDLPKKWTAHSSCFRKEAGSYGKDMRGMIRNHQFEKVELVQIVRPEDSDQALETLVNHAETVLKLLELPYRKMLLCSKDIGFSASKTYDLEVWLPGQNAYREISSCSNCKDFQARRMQARFKRGAMGKPELVHTLNGSGLAVGRTLVAVMENYQNADGSVRVPKVLEKYFI